MTENDDTFKAIITAHQLKSMLEGEQLLEDYYSVKCAMDYAQSYAIREGKRAFVVIEVTPSTKQETCPRCIL